MFRMKVVCGAFWREISVIITGNEYDMQGDEN